MHVHNGHIIGAAGLLAPILALYAPLGLAPLFAVTALATLVIACRSRRLGAFAPNGAMVWFGLLALWAATSLIWSIDVLESMSKLPRFIAMLAGGVILVGAAVDLTTEERRSMGRLLVTGIVIAVAILAIERLADMPIHRLLGKLSPDTTQSLASFNRAATFIALAVWPAAMTIWRRQRAVAIALAAGTLAVLTSLQSNAAITGLAIGIVVFAATLAFPRRLPRIMAALFAVFIAVSPWIYGWALDPARLQIDTSILTKDDSIFPRSGYHRLLIWNFTADRIMERPVIGWGMNTSRVIPGGGVKLDASETALPLHPHNGVLQLWLELGAVGALLGAGLLIRMLMRTTAWTGDPVERAACTGLTMTGFVIVCLSYGLWQSWWMAALFFAAAFAASARERGPETASG